MTAPSIHEDPDDWFDSYRDYTPSGPPKAEDSGRWLYTHLAGSELRALENVRAPNTAVTSAYVTARGFTALTYAVLALAGACEDQGAGISKVLSDLADSAGGTAGSVARIAEKADRPSLRYRLVALLTRMRGGTPEPW
jgi:hypothetical protein